jgi:hypothetical protein
VLRTWPIGPFVAVAVRLGLLALVRLSLVLLALVTGVLLRR